MKVFVFFATIITLTHADKRCHGVYIDHKYYDLDIIKDGINHIYDLVVNRNDNSIYFTFEDMSKTPSRFLGHIDIDTRKATVINGIRNATAIAIDQFYGKVYVGGEEGLFKINEKKIPERLPIQDDVKSMHYKDGLYFTNRKREAFKFEDGFATAIPELRGIEVDKLILDDDNNIFFTQNKKLFRIKLGTKAINTHERHEANAIATDIYSRAYLCTNNGLYIYNKYKYVFDKIAELYNLKALTFHKMNDPVYAVADFIVKLRLSPIGCFED